MRPRQSPRLKFHDDGSRGARDCRSCTSNLESLRRPSRIINCRNPRFPVLTANQAARKNAVNRPLTHQPRNSPPIQGTGADNPSARLQIVVVSASSQRDSRHHRAREASPERSRQRSRRRLAGVERRFERSDPWEGERWLCKLRGEAPCRIDRVVRDADHDVAFLWRGTP